jgi:hypothetical protein
MKLDRLTCEEATRLILSESPAEERLLQLACEHVETCACWEDTRRFVDENRSALEGLFEREEAERSDRVKIARVAPSTVNEGAAQPTAASLACPGAHVSAVDRALKEVVWHVMGVHALLMAAEAFGGFASVLFALPTAKIISHGESLLLGIGGLMVIFLAANVALLDPYFRRVKAVVLELDSFAMQRKECPLELRLRLGEMLIKRWRRLCQVLPMLGILGYGAWGIFAGYVMDLPRAEWQSMMWHALAVGAVANLLFFELRLWWFDITRLFLEDSHDRREVERCLENVQRRALVPRLYRWIQGRVEGRGLTRRQAPMVTDIYFIFQAVVFVLLIFYVFGQLATRASLAAQAAEIGIPEQARQFAQLLHVAFAVVGIVISCLALAYGWYRGLSIPVRRYKDIAFRNLVLRFASLTGVSVRVEGNEGEEIPGGIGGSSLTIQQEDGVIELRRYCFVAEPGKKAV